MKSAIPDNNTFAGCATRVYVEPCDAMAPGDIVVRVVQVEAPFDSPEVGVGSSVIVFQPAKISTEFQVKSNDVESFIEAVRAAHGWRGSMNELTALLNSDDD